MTIDAYPDLQYDIYFYDGNGKLISMQNDVEGNNELILNLPLGIYWYKIFSEDQCNLGFGKLVVL